jgi:hypothetical protein
LPLLSESVSLTLIRQSLSDASSGQLFEDFRHGLCMGIALKTSARHQPTVGRLPTYASQLMPSGRLASTNASSRARLVQIRDATPPSPDHTHAKVRLTCASGALHISQARVATGAGASSSIIAIVGTAGGFVSTCGGGQSSLLTQACDQLCVLAAGVGQAGVDVCRGAHQHEVSKTECHRCSLIASC